MRTIIYIFFIASFSVTHSQSVKKNFRVIAFYTAKHDLAHISFVNEAHQWFSLQSIEHNFEYDSTKDWNNLNEQALKNYDVVLFLDTRPEEESQRTAFRKYMESGGAWMGFHFAAFALNNSTYPQNWDWYHNTFLGSGEYKGNTWRPTSAILRVEKKNHPFVKNLWPSFKSGPNEWYSWTNDLQSNPDIEILLSIDPQSFPLGTGPKQHEIWHNGYYPVAWRSKRYRMIYINMGHNDMDYENGTNKQLSSSFSSTEQNQFIIQCLQWLAKKRGNSKR
ncbi:ThuA domain-containing protein [Chryseosolibacter indicus]|uniref:ThuA domain-containing protein n=1 Tax=Chryseosolibacter indicus TaxID=2782351 RepID=A0ABS5VPY3_9BACT|nr:ThuA domain-containing protein [Chryseosolibacter indicus]MBT1703509.1 ThuA domain-containing protein [Chryseosolibacter indicus]